ncbi:hypothetical protein WN48_06055, partial [Eufriesea mexicana]
ITFKLLRTFVTKSRPESVGVQGKIKLTKMYKSDAKVIAEDDIEVYGSDFMKITDSYINHNREELAAKELLKRRVVKSKVFNEIEPSFLTYIEKDQIKKLHENNPEEWTLEKLSESFPALPKTIRKVLKAKWVPKSKERILQYDNKVIKNWKQLKTGKLKVNSILKQHLMKFKNRKILLTDREPLIEKFISPKIEYPKPKSFFFSNIIKNNINDEPVIKNKLLICSQNNTNKDDKNYNSRDKKNVRLGQTVTNDLIHKLTKNNTKQEALIFEEFLKMKLNSSDEISYEERLTLIDTYKKYIDSKNIENIGSNMLNNSTENTSIEEKSLSTIKNSSNECTLNAKEDTTEFKITMKNNIEHTSLDTYVKERNSFVDMNFEYVKCIKIPKNVYRKGMTYKIKDCYYDDDGEFLYRIPGLKV